MFAVVAEFGGAPRFMATWRLFDRPVWVLGEHGDVRLTKFRKNAEQDARLFGGAVAEVKEG